MWFLAQVADPEVPTWGWLTIIGALASTVATLGSLYRSARDREVAAERSKVLLVEKVGTRTSELLERAIEAFNQNRTGNDRLAEKLSELVTEIRELKEEVRHGPK